jgi:hypothetical protein
MAEKLGFHHISVARSRNSFTGRTDESEAGRRVLNAQHEPVAKLGPKGVAVSLMG